MPEAAPASDERKRLIRRIHAEARSRGMDTDARRDLQRSATGKVSCADMTVDELRSVIRAMGTPRDRLPQGPGAGKLRALWISAWHLGVVRDRTDAGLAAWLRRQTGLETAAWTDPAGLARAIEALKLWLAREAGVDWSPSARIDRHGRTHEHDNPRARVMEAQWRILARLGAVESDSGAALSACAAQHAEPGRAGSHLALDDRQADALIRHLGARIRAAKDGDA